MFWAGEQREGDGALNRPLLFVHAQDGLLLL